jgi:predicted ribosomally synthesized peptide with nif11-like leader
MKDTAMAEKVVNQFLDRVRNDKALKERLKAATNWQSCQQIAEDSGYHFTYQELEAGLNELPDEEVAAMINPGVAPRRHLSPR